jgi:hypothetical protein
MLNLIPRQTRETERSSLTKVITVADKLVDSNFNTRILDESALVLINSWITKFKYVNGGECADSSIQ